MQKDQLYQILRNLTNYKIPDKFTIFNIIKQSIQLHSNLKNCVDIEITSPDLQLYVVGDLHGQFEDLMQIMQIIDEKDESNPKQLLFLGDIIDRGLRSLETLLYILCMQLLWPNRITILRGNHETERISRYYGFYDECQRKGCQMCYLCSLQLFQALPISCSINFSIKADYSQMTNSSPTQSQKQDFPECFYEKFYVSQVNSQVVQSFDSPVIKQPNTISFSQMTKPTCNCFQNNFDFKKVHFHWKTPQQNANKSQISNSPAPFYTHDCEFQDSQNTLERFDSSRFKPDESIFGEQSVNSSITLSTFQETKLQRIFACHGGISQKMSSVDDLMLKLRIFNDFDDTLDQGLIMDVLWSDPDENYDYFSKSQRGCSYTYGSKVLNQFLTQNQYDIVLRAHQMQSQGFSKCLGDRVVTVWSAANYEQRCANMGAFVLLQNGDMYQRRFGKKYPQEEKRPTAQIDYFL